MPDLLVALVKRLVRWGVLPARMAPDSAIINIYDVVGDILSCLTADTYHRSIVLRNALAAIEESHSRLPQEPCSTAAWHCHGVVSSGEACSQAESMQQCRHVRAE